MDVPPLNCLEAHTSPSLLDRWMIEPKLVYPPPKVVQVSRDPVTNAITPDAQLPGWVFSTKLVAKVGQLLIKR